MEIILKQDVEKLGHKDDLIDVKPGYARNCLIPRGLAMLATKSAKKMHEENLKQKAHKEEKLIKEAEEIKEKMDGLTLKIGAKTSSTGKIFGSVNNIMISEALSKEGFDINKKDITVKEPAIKEIGTYNANVKIYKKIEANIIFEVISE